MHRGNKFPKFQRFKTYLKNTPGPGTYYVGHDPNKYPRIHCDHHLHPEDFIEPSPRPKTQERPSPRKIIARKKPSIATNDSRLNESGSFREFIPDPAPPKTPTIPKKQPKTDEEPSRIRIKKIE